MKTKDLKIEYIEELADIVMNEVDVNDDDEKSISIIGKYEEIKEVLKAIIAGYEVDIMGLELPHPEWNGYDKEYDLSVWSCDGEITINCEAIQRDGEYLNLEGDILYIFDNCSSKILQNTNYHKSYSVSVDDDECECDCCECCDCNNDNDIYGFTVDNKTDNGYSKFTYYSSSPVDKTDIRNILREFRF